MDMRERVARELYAQAIAGKDVASLSFDQLPDVFREVWLIQADRLLSLMGEDGRRLDWLADEQAVDGIGTFDCHDAACRLVSADATDEDYMVAYRTAFRQAIDHFRTDTTDALRTSVKSLENLGYTVTEVLSSEARND